MSGDVLQKSPSLPFPSPHMIPSAIDEVLTTKRNLNRSRKLHPFAWSIVSLLLLVDVFLLDLALGTLLFPWLPIQYLRPMEIAYAVILLVNCAYSGWAVYESCWPSTSSLNDHQLRLLGVDKADFVSTNQLHQSALLTPPTVVSSLTRPRDNFAWLFKLRNKVWGRRDTRRIMESSSGQLRYHPSSPSSNAVHSSSVDSSILAGLSQFGVYSNCSSLASRVGSNRSPYVKVIDNDDNGIDNSSLKDISASYRGSEHSFNLSESYQSSAHIMDVRDASRSLAYSSASFGGGHITGYELGTAVDESIKLKKEESFGSYGASPLSKHYGNSDPNSSFRMEINAAVSPGKIVPIIRRSESWEKHQHRRSSSSISIGSPTTSTHSQLSTAIGTPMGSPRVNRFQSGSETIFALYVEFFYYPVNCLSYRIYDAALVECRLRVWLSNTILKPFAETVDTINKHLDEHYAALHLRIGVSTPDTLQTTLNNKVELWSTALPYVLSYLRIHSNQAYLVRRIRELGSDLFMKDFHWQSGGMEIRQPITGDTLPQILQWPPDHLPSDSDLVWQSFLVYLNSKLPLNPLVSDTDCSFSEVYTLRAPGRPNILQRHADAFYIHMVDITPPHFELIIDGGRERIDVGKGRHNLFQTILLFLAHCRDTTDGYLGGLSLGEKGINLLCVLDES